MDVGGFGWGDEEGFVLACVGGAGDEFEVDGGGGVGGVEGDGGVDFDGVGCGVDADVIGKGGEVVGGVWRCWSGLCWCVVRVLLGVDVVCGARCCEEGLRRGRMRRVLARSALDLVGVDV